MTSVLGKYVKDKLDEINKKKLSYYGVDLTTITRQEQEEIATMEAQEKILLEVVEICETRGRY